MDEENHLNQAREEAADRAELVLQIVRTVAVELHPHLKQSINISLDSSLERELGFDTQEVLVKADQKVKCQRRNNENKEQCSTDKQNR